MSETLSTHDVRQRLGDLLDRVESGRDQFVIERRGRRLAALVPYEKLERLERAAENALLEGLEAQRRKLALRQAERAAARSRSARRRD